MKVRIVQEFDDVIKKPEMLNALKKKQRNKRVTEKKIQS